MRKVISFMHMSVDGIISRPSDQPYGELDWISYSSELEAYAHSMHATSDVAIHGRTTYGMMQGYWPTVFNDPEATPAALAHATWLRDALKIVVSRTMDSTDWENSRLIKDNLAGEINALKQQAGKDMIIFGSPGLVRSMLAQDLIDEFRITVSPIILGRGVSFFGSLAHERKLRLLENRTISGVAVLHYERVRE